jgi:hypothetical protein
MKKRQSFRHASVKAFAKFTPCLLPTRHRPPQVASREQPQPSTRHELHVPSPPVSTTVLDGDAIRGRGNPEPFERAIQDVEAPATRQDHSRTRQARPNRCNDRHAMDIHPGRACVSARRKAG